jgi:tetratricopeptide (TPR) repeat protein
MKKYIILICLIFPLITIGQANKLIRKALKSEDPNEQIQLYTEAISLEPKNLDALFYRGLTKHSIGDFNGAILDYTKVIFYEPSADVYFNRGNSKYSLMDLNGAKEDYSNALKLNSQFIEARYSLAVTKNDLKDYHGAIAILDLPYVNKSHPILLQMARAYAGLEDHVKALQNYTNAILLNSDSNTFYARGVFFMDVNYFKKANNDFIAAIFLDKNNVPAYFFRGMSSFFLGEYQKALSDFSTAVQFDVTDFDAVIGVALANLKLNDIANAKLNFDKAKSIIRGTDISQEDNLELFKNTYWFQKQYYAFRDLYNEISKL